MIGHVYFCSAVTALTCPPLSVSAVTALTCPPFYVSAVTALTCPGAAAALACPHFW